MSFDINRVQELYEVVHNLPQEQREAFLLDECADDHTLRREVMSLLSLDTEDPLFPDDPLIGERVDSWLGERIGPYLIDRQLGQGGMGAVYLAKRIDGEIEMTVSIKLIQPQFTTPEALARFKRERQLLADLRHAHIAVLLDAGATKSGHPYLIMEYIKGHTIDAWHEQAKPSLTDLLKLFTQLARAVGFAHEHGVIHRDIKPGNIMVTHAGEPKLLDFGIAAFADNEREKTGQQGPMTPQYAAPEQMRGEALSEATDIYALGLVLLQLLLGRSPRHWSQDPIAMIAMLTPQGRNIHNTDMDVSPIPEALAHVLRTALAENPRRRYQGAAGLITDLSRVPALLPENEPDTLSKPYDVFFWHHPDDHKDIAVLAENLTATGRKIWPGHGSWDTPNPQLSFAEAPEVTRVCLVGLGPQQRAPWRMSPDTHPVFQQHNLRVVPLLLPGADFPLKQSELPPYLRGRAWITFYGGLTNKNLSQMVHVVGGFDLVDGIDSEPTAPNAGVSCPYRGLEVFREEDSRFFVGREAVSQRIAAYLRENHFIGVLGPSGSGKSSVVQAGVMPQLRDLGYTPLIIKPGVNPLEEMAWALTKQISTTTDNSTQSDILARLLADESALHYITLVQVDEEITRFCIVLDQFEEVFTLAKDPHQTARFVDNLCHAAEQPDSVVSVMLTMRSDFLGKCPIYPRLNTLLLDNAVQLEPMPREDLARAIETPARLAGLQLEAGLLQRILDDVTGAPGDLPLLEHALLELYERRSNSMLTLEAYQAVGGIEGALARRAEMEFQSHSETDQINIRKMFTLSLITPGEGAEDTRRRATTEELAAVSGDRQKTSQLLNVWINARLLTAWRDNARRLDYVDVAHEALIRKWPRITEWMAQDRQTARLLGDLRQRANSWREADHDEAHLLRGGLLYQMRELIAREDVNPDHPADAFLQASIAMEEGLIREEAAVKRRLMRRRNQALTAGAFSLLLAAFGFFMYFRADRAEDAAIIARDRADMQTRQSNYNLARMFQQESVALLEEDRAQTAWLFALAALAADIPEDKNLPGAVGQFTDPRINTVEAVLWTSPVAFNACTVAFNEDGSIFAMAGTDQHIRLVDTQSGGYITSLVGHSDQITRLTFVGNDLITASLDGTVRIFANTEGAWRVRPDAGGLLEHSSAVTDMALNPAGDLLATVTITGQIHLWRQSDGKHLKSLDTQLKPLDSITFAPSGGAIYAGSRSGGLIKTDPQLSTLMTLSDSLPVSALTAYGDRLFSAGLDGGLDVWPLDSSDPKPSRIDTSPDALLALAVSSPDASQAVLATMSRNGSLTIRRLPDLNITYTGTTFGRPVIDTAGLALHDDMLGVVQGGLLPQIHAVSDGALMAAMSGHSEVVWSTAFSPDGTILASASADNSIILWDAKSGTQIARLNQHSSRIPGLNFSPDGSLLVSASLDQSAIVWDLDTRKPKLILDDHQTGLRQAVYTRDGSIIATSALDGQVRLWDSESGRAIAQLPNTSGIMRVLTFSPDGHTLAGAGLKKAVVLWDRERLTKPLVIPLKTRVTAVAFSPDGNILAAGQHSGDIKLWHITANTNPMGSRFKLREGNEFKIHNSSVSSLTFSIDGRTIHTTSADATLKFTDVESGRNINTHIGHKLDILSSALSPDGRLLATVSYDKTVKVWDVAKPMLPSSLTGPGGKIMGVVSSPDSRLLAMSTTKGFIRVWDHQTQTYPYVLNDPVNEFHQIAFSPDNTVLSTSARDGGIRLWSLKDNKVTKLYNHTSVAYSTKFSQDSRMLASSCADGTIILWDLMENKQRHTYTGHMDLIRDLDFSPDGSQLVSASFDHTLRIWDTQDYSNIAVLQGHAGQIYATDWSPDGNVIASVSGDGSVRLWDPYTHTQIQAVSTVLTTCEDVEFSEDGRFLVVSTYNGPIHVYDAKDYQLLARLDNQGYLVNPIAISPGDNLLVSIKNGTDLAFWQLNELDLIAPPQEIDYKALYLSSLYYFGYRKEGTELISEPRFLLKAEGDFRFPSQPKHHKLNQPRPTDIRLLTWLSEPQ